jgi:uncharacterized protein (TIGR02246 family)
MSMRRYLVAGLAALVVSGAGAQAQEKAHPAKKLSLEQRQQLTEDKEAIRDLLVAYGRAFDSRDFAAYAALFAPDGVWVGGSQGGQSYTGPDAIRAFVNKIYPPTVNPGSFHIMSSVTIQMDGPDSATAWSRWTYVVLGVHGEPAPFRAGHYEDILVRVGGVWKFKRRQVFSEAKQP